MDRAAFNHRLATTPENPGVYIMKDAQDRVLYVGKASNLKNRVGYYFGSPYNLPHKIRTMASRIADYEFIITHSSAEALILENTLIKKYKPPFNARLKDDKTYPFLKIDLAEEFPQIYITRRVNNDGARYFGPFATAGSVRKTMDLLKRLFPYRSCTKTITGTDPRPCLEYYINRCNAPCIGAVNKEEYGQVIQQVVMFMEGKTEVVVDDLRQRMEQASNKLEFERAAVLRDQMRSVHRVSEEQRIKVDTTATYDADVVAMAGAEDETRMEVFFIRHGRLMGRDHFIMVGTQDSEPSHVMAQFIKQFYLSASNVPRRILIQHPLEEQEQIEQWLRQERGKAVTLLCPQRGKYHQLVQMAAENAFQGLSQSRAKWLSNADATYQALVELQEELHLPNPPHRMECYDISNIQGTNSVGSMVTFEEGAPKTAHYRRFRIKNVAGVDDYSSMQEVLRRRFKRLSDLKGKAGPQPTDEPHRTGDESWGIVPDLVLIDGGKGHLSAALEVFLEMGIDFIPLASLAKENEWIFLPHTPEPVILPRNSQSLYLVQRIRDEAHRFAITYHRNLRSKRSTVSPIDMVTGIGPKRKRMLMRRFGTLKGIKEAPVEEIAAMPGMTRSLASRLKESL